MIDARCDIERQLQAANKHIAELEKVNGDSAKAQ
jgi:methyl-accepting chemotaxis protein